ncbi:ferredoxin-thioredoxin reductase catalytic domain-containing protein [Thermoproteota archaeon]
MTGMDEARKRAEIDAKRNRMYLCPVHDLLNDLLKGLTKNEERYSYPSCPCRIASGDIEKDRDIICPCDYRDPDVEEYGQCYCALYVNEKVYNGEEPTQSIPERRPFEKQMGSLGFDEEHEAIENLGEAQSTNRKLLYCKQCGYTIFREDPPYKCPICQAKRELFAEIIIGDMIKTREIY